jgi:hypothetical protein
MIRRSSVCFRETERNRSHVEEKLGTETTGAWFDVKKTVDDFYMEVTRCFRPKASEAFVMRTGAYYL